MNSEDKTEKSKKRIKSAKKHHFITQLKPITPVYVFFTAYSQPTGLFEKLKKAKVTVYVSEPFYPDPDKTLKDAQT